MTMHMLGPQFTTLSTRKRKSKLSNSQYHNYAIECADYNKRMKKLGASTKTLEEYIAYRQGKYKPKLKGVAAPKYHSDNHREQYPSGVGIGVAFAKKPNEYSGERRLIGIATMHKSNQVPVFSEDDAKDLARMRR